MFKQKSLNKFAMLSVVTAYVAYVAAAAKRTNQKKCLIIKQATFFSLSHHKKSLRASFFQKHVCNTHKRLAQICKRKNEKKNAHI